jgi:ribosomal-protein-alanine N-acetyltransferase
MAKQTGESAGSCGNNTAKKKLFSEIPYLKGKRLTLKRLTRADRSALQELVDSPRIYRYLPTFLFEQKYPDIGYVIDHLYDECWKESIILGVFLGDEFCGLAEMYGYRDPIHKISVGYRLLERYWGKGIAKEALGMMIDYLYDETDIEIITASTMVENQASANVLRKNGFQMVVHAVDEDWGYDKPTVSDKWIR